MPTVAYNPPVKEDKLYTLDEFLGMDFDEKVELVEGKIIHMGYTNFVHAMLTSWLSHILTSWSEEADWGWITGGDSGVLTKQNPDSARGADLACISFERYAKVQRKGKVIDVGPELLIEIVSPSNTWNEIEDKVGEYFAIETGEVWVVSPKHRRVTVYLAPDKPVVYDAAKHDTVISEQLPGFELPLKKMAKLIQKAEGEEQVD